MSLRDQHQDPDAMTPEERAFAIASLLAASLLRHIRSEVSRTTNAAESINARIKRIKAMACGYRNRDRFRNAILFHLGGLDLYPRIASAHTEA